MKFYQCVLLVASLGMASAFVAPAGHGLALRSAKAAHSPLVASTGVRAARKVAGGATMQLQEMADGAQTLLAAYPFQGALTAYMNLYVPIFKGLNLPPFLLHWFHALNMGTVLFAMGGYGTYLGFNIRSSPETKLDLAPGPALGKSSSEMHKTLMIAMAGIFFLGANGGLVLCLVQDKPITESAHFTTAMAGFALLAIQRYETWDWLTARAGEQASITKLFNGEQNDAARTAHAVFGSATMGLFLYHAYLGLQLGLSLSSSA